MKIVCPSCQAQYEVPEVVLTSRRKMRCARCAEEWVPGDARAPQKPLAAAEVQAEPIVPEPDFDQSFAPPPPVTPPPSVHDHDEDELATMASPALLWAATEGHAPEPGHELESAPVEPVAPPPRPLALRPETPVTLRHALPDPSSIVVPEAAKGPPVVAWVVSVAIVVGVLAAMVVFRAPIMKVWPPSGRLYAVMGMAGQ